MSNNDPSNPESSKKRCCPNPFDFLRSDKAANPSAESIPTSIDISGTTPTQAQKKPRRPRHVTSQSVATHASPDGPSTDGTSEGVAPTTTRSPSDSLVIWRTMDFSIIHEPHVAETAETQSGSQTIASEAGSRGTPQGWP